jgi:hypothetical protein
MPGATARGGSPRDRFEQRPLLSTLAGRRRWSPGACRRHSSSSAWAALTAFRTFFSAEVPAIEWPLGGETWIIPLGVVASLRLAVLTSAPLPEAAWETAGGFCLAVFVLAALAYSRGRS